MGARADESAAAGAVRGDAPEIVYVIDGSADWTVLEVSTREAMSRHRKSEDPLQSRTACLSTVDRRLTIGVTPAARCFPAREARSWR